MRAMLSLGLMLLLAAPAAAAPVDARLAGQLDAAREAYRATLQFPLAADGLAALAQPAPGGPAAAYQQVGREVAAIRRTRDPHDPYLARRGMWVRPYPADVTRARVLEVFDRAEALGVGAIYLETFYGGQVVYPRSKVFPSKFGEVDIARAYAAEAKRRGMKLYAWAHTLKWSEAYAKEHPDQLVLDGFGKPATSTEGAAAWIVSPSVPDVRARLIRLADEIAHLGYYDGLILDYIRYPVRLKGDDVDETPDPRNFWGYTPAAQAAFYRENPAWDTPDYRRFLAENVLPDESLRETWLKVWKDWLAHEIEALIADVRKRTEGHIELSMAFFPSYYFHRHDNRVQESKRWMAYFDWVTPMCYSYFLDTFPDPFGTYTINRELSIVEDGLSDYLSSERPAVIASLTEDPPGTAMSARYHHQRFATQLAWLKGRKQERAFPNLAGMAYFSYGWLFPASDRERRENR